MTSESGAADRRSGLYVHVPYCRTKCPYCDFYSETAAPTEEWVDAVLAEARSLAGRFGVFDTVYLGGGTPSALPIATLERLFRGLRDTVTLTPGAELTLEVNPDDVDVEKLDRWIALGFDRLSVGAQSFAADDLFFLGRRHTAAQTHSALESARSAGFANLGIDLIFGLPGQAVENWRDNLARALEYEPEHLSCYQLTVAPETPFGARARHGELLAPGEGTGRELFLATAEVLGNAGYDHYEISNFARETKLRSRHNLKYWRHQPVLGLGPAAHSYLDGDRWWNVRSVADYVQRFSAGSSPRDGHEALGDDELLLERLMLGFRTSDGVALETLRLIPGWQQTLDQLVDEGLALSRDGRARPTVAGFLLADGLPLRFQV